VENCVYFRLHGAASPLKKPAEAGREHFRFTSIYQKSEKEKCQAGSEKDPEKILLAWMMGWKAGKGTTSCGDT
jgi:hypothetical protein